MKRLTVITHDGLPITYADAALRLGVTMPTLYERLCRHRKAHPGTIVALEALRLPNAVHNMLIGPEDRRMTYAEAGRRLRITRPRLYEIIREIRARSPAIRDGAPIPFLLLQSCVTHELIPGTIKYRVITNYRALPPRPGARP